VASLIGAGGRISVTVPVYALTFVWGAIIGVLVDKEPFNQAQAFGVLLVFVGVAVVGARAPR
jgi:drug/metabolite transporter (DMT)-like permease